MIIYTYGGGPFGNMCRDDIEGETYPNKVCKEECEGSVFVEVALTKNCRTF